ncbi:siroheme synthase CysG [Alcanivorax sp. 1008]|uniref:siroheme synthase CysG n=1 Tax=Alcanivorax sp. 1008 TaxID=2816853 RepID=UPI001DD04D33|nr:siroheme synthase CysG [Alcanivorax sp. 1008]MCC1497775.1 uroporphyrinogen-III C-methyltransferase [Alcanivorax sp. 1008]
MDYLPVSWRLRDQLALLVGGGDIALRKGRLLVRAGARLRVVAPQIEAELKLLIEQQGGEWLPETYQTHHLDGVVLAIGATDDNDVNRQLNADAVARQLPVNVVDNPPLCTFIFPAIVDRDPLLISISSGGASPVLARWARSKIETLFPARLGKLAELMGRFRKPLAEKLPQIGARRLFWEGLLDGPLMEKVLAGQQAEAETLLSDAVTNADIQKLSQGEVYLVGAGPGDPDLMTFRALRLLQKADIVLYDRLVGKGILELARRDAELVYVGKARNEHVVPQQEINNLLVKYALEGKKVCRLKGGDPFIFGRGGEELDSVVAAGISFQVVPGVTAAAGCASYAGIPLTHRDHAQSVRFITGHRKDGSVDLPWANLNTVNETLVFYMGLVSLAEICSNLLAQGMATDMPAAIVSRGTLEDQQVIISSISSLPDKVATMEVAAPSLLIIGTVVTLHPRYSWFM